MVGKKTPPKTNYPFLSVSKEIYREFTLIFLSCSPLFPGFRFVNLFIAFLSYTELWLANFLGKAEILSEKSRIGTQCFAKS